MFEEDDGFILVKGTLEDMVWAKRHDPDKCRVGSKGLLFGFGGTLGRFAVSIMQPVHGKHGFPTHGTCNVEGSVVSTGGFVQLKFQFQPLEKARCWPSVVAQAVGVYNDLAIIGHVSMAPDTTQVLTWSTAPLECPRGRKEVDEADEVHNLGSVKVGMLGELVGDGRSRHIGVHI